MSEIIKIVLTGGPCAGKTEAAQYLQKRLSGHNINVKVVEDQAAELKRGGKTPENSGRYEFYRLVFERALERERRALREAELSNAEKTVILYDGGLLDIRAYVTEEEFDKYSSPNVLSEEIIRSRCDAVFHLVTAAERSVGNLTPEKAKELDKKILALWTGTPHLRVIDNSTDLSGKLERLHREVTGFLGEPEPLEIERKLLIDYPDTEELERLPFCRRVPMTQAYLYTPEEGNFRIRMRGSRDAVYIKTKKIKISDIKRIEKETYISESEFKAYLNNRDAVKGIITKERYCIVYDNTYYELDIYPFWRDRATLEVELLSEDESFALPPFVKLIREVTFEPEYRNFALAQNYRPALL